jgi:hypothetical protein
MALLVHDQEVAHEAFMPSVVIASRCGRRNDVRIIGLETRQVGAAEHPTGENENIGYERQMACRRWERMNETETKCLHGNTSPRRNEGARESAALISR